MTLRLQRRLCLWLLLWSLLEKTALSTERLAFDSSANTGGDYEDESNNDKIEEVIPKYMDSELKPIEKENIIHEKKEHHSQKQVENATIPLTAIKDDTTALVGTVKTTTHLDHDRPKPPTLTNEIPLSEDTPSGSGIIVGSSSSSIKDGKRLWGHPDHQHHYTQQIPSSTAVNGTAAPDKSSSPKPDDNIGSNTNNKQPLPFVSKHSSAIPHNPPEGFVVNARVYIDSEDKLSHLDTHTSLVLPYWECGTAGSTTSPLPLKHATFRHAFGTMTSSWTTDSTTDFTTTTGANPHPMLLVALRPLVLELNSGDTQSFPAGAVILLEDTLKPGYRLQPLAPQTEVQVVFLTLPQSYYQTGKQHLSIQSYLQQAKDKTASTPCPNSWISSSSTSLSEVSTSSWLPPDTTTHSPTVQRGRSVRLALLAMVGLSLSTLLADFLGKVAPLWLAVGVGGTCLVAAGTYAVISSGEWLYTHWQVQQERRKMHHRPVRDSSVSVRDNDEDNEGISSNENSDTSDLDTMVDTQS
jgi:hypothetical protein